MWRSRKPFHAGAGSVLSHPEQCNIQQISIDQERILSFAILIGLSAFAAGYFLRDLSRNIQRGTSRVTAALICIQSLSSLATKTSVQQYRAFSDIYEAVEGHKSEQPDVSEDSDSDSASESDVETPKAIKETAYEYFPPTMSRRRLPDTPIPPSAWSECVSYDQTVMDWTTAFVEESVGPIAVSMVRATAPKKGNAVPLSRIDTTKLFVDIYEAFKGEVAQVMVS